MIKKPTRGGLTERLETAERRHFVLSERRKGSSYRQIASMAVDKFGAGHLPLGWDERYAAKDVSRELERLRSEVLENVENLRDLELQRLDSMQTALWPKAMNGDVKAVDRILRIMHRRSNYVKLEAAEHADTGAARMIADALRASAEQNRELFSLWDKELEEDSL
jgi:hypothetical protein